MRLQARMRRAKEGRGQATGGGKDFTNEAACRSEEGGDQAAGRNEDGRKRLQARDEEGKIEVAGRGEEDRNKTADGVRKAERRL